MVDISTQIEKLRNAIYGEEVRGTLIDLAEDFNNRIGDGLIFIAEYGVTTHAEIMEAVNKGQAVLALRNKVPHVLCQTPNSSGGSANFVRLSSAGYQVVVISCSKSNAWTSSNITLATQSWVTSKINTSIESAITTAIEGSY